MQLNPEKERELCSPKSSSAQTLLTNDRNAIALFSKSEFKQNISPKQEKKTFFATTGLLTLAGLLVLGTPHAIASSLRGLLISCGGPTSEVERSLEAMNSAQADHLAEKNAFANDFEKLGVGIESQTEDYQYSTRATAQAAFNYGLARKNDLPSYVGAVFIVPATNVAPKAAQDEVKILTILCAAESPGKTKPADPTYQNGEVACGDKTTELYRYSR